MKTLGMTLCGALLSLAAGTLVACYPDQWMDDSGQSTSNINAADEEEEAKVDQLEGAYLRQGVDKGAREINYVFKPSADGEDNSFFGEIQVGEIKSGGEKARAHGNYQVGSDDLGTTLKLTLKEEKKGSSASNDAKAGAGAAVATTTTSAESKAMVESAFSGLMHYLKIGKKKTILVRSEETTKTSQFKRVDSWCAAAADCKSDVQKTDLSCSTPKCSTKHTCTCD